MKFYLIFAIFLFCLLSNAAGQVSLDVNSGKSTLADKSRVKALIFGISGYKNLPLEKQLEYADDDAVSFYQFLLDRPDIIKPHNITALFNAEASGQNKIKSLLYDALVADAQAGDLVIIYFTGHGDVQKFSANQQEAFLLFHDVQRNSDYLAPGNDALPVRDLQHYIQLAPDGVKVLLITDACRSGKLLESTDQTSLFLASVARDWEKTHKLVSCQPNQLSFENKKWGGGHGVFSHFLLWALKGVADVNNDRALQFYEIYDFVKKHVQQETQHEQIPKALGDETVSFFPVDVAMKNKAQKAFAGEVPTTLDFQASSLLLRIMSTGVKGFGANYFFGINADQQYFLDQFTRTVQNKELLPGDVKSTSVKADLKVSKKQKLKHLDFGLHEFAVSPDGKLLAVGGDTDKIELYDRSTNRLLKKMPHRGVLELRFSEDGNFLFSGGWDNRMKVWDVKKGKEITSVVAHNNDIRNFAFSLKNMLIVSAGDGNEISFWNSSDFSHLARWKKLHKGRVTALQFGNGDSCLYTAGTDGNIFKRDLVSGGKMAVFRYRKPINDIYLHQKQHVLLAVSDDGSVLALNPETLNLKKRQKISDYALTEIEGNDLIDVAFVAGKQHLFYSVDVDLVEKRARYPIPRGVNGLQIDPLKNRLVVSTWGDNIYEYQFKNLVPRNYADAWVQYNQIIQNKKMLHLKRRVQNYYATALQQEAIEVIQPFINGDAKLPGFEEIARAQKCLNYAAKVVEDDKFSMNRIHNNQKLLGIYETLKSDDFGNLPEAIASLKEIMEQEKDAAYTHNTISVLYRKLNELAKAGESSGKAAELIPRWAEPKINIGKVFFAEGKYKKAMAEYQKVIELEPENYKGYLHKAEVMAFLGKRDSARQLAEKAAQLASDKEIVLCRVAGVWLKTDHLKMADTWLQKALLIDSLPGKAELDLAMLNIYQLENYFASTGKINFHFLYQAQKHIKNVEGNQNFVNEIHLAKGNLALLAYEMHGKIANALKTRVLQIFEVNSAHKLIYLAFKNFNEVSDINPMSKEAVWGLARTKVASGNWDKALWYIDQLERLMPESPLPDYLRGRTYLYGNKVRKGREALYGSIEKDSLYFPAYFHLVHTANRGSDRSWPFRWLADDSLEKLKQLEKKAISRFQTPFIEKEQVLQSQVYPYLP